MSFMSLLTGFGLSVSVSAFMSGDNSLPVTSERLKEVDVAYYQYFPCHGSDCHRHVEGCRPVYRSAVSNAVSRWFFQCTATMQFLRPVNVIKKWQLAENGRGYLSIKVKKPGIANGYRPLAGQSKGIVTGKFKRYAADVRQYTFKTIKTGIISTVNSTPEHLFYVKNRHRFMPITDISPRDRLITASGEPVALLCHPRQKTHCGVSVNSGLPAPVFNFEVYRRHVYFVGDAAVTVHNICGNDLVRAFGGMDVESLASEESFNSSLPDPSGNPQAKQASKVRRTPKNRRTPGTRQTSPSPLIDPVSLDEVTDRQGLRFISVNNEMRAVKETNDRYSLKTLQSLFSKNMLRTSPITTNRLICFYDNNGKIYTFNDLPYMTFYKGRHWVGGKEAKPPVNEDELSLEGTMYPMNSTRYSDTAVFMFMAMSAFSIFSYFCL